MANQFIIPKHTALEISTYRTVLSLTGGVDISDSNTNVNSDNGSDEHIDNKESENTSNQNGGDHRKGRALEVALNVASEHELTVTPAIAKRPKPAYWNDMNWNQKKKWNRRRH